MFIPSIIETTGRTSKAFDLPTKLLQDRIVYIGSEIDELSTNSVIMQLLWLNSDSQEPIDLYITSPGGSVYHGLAIKDIIQKISCKVNTIGIGLVASMGTYLLSAGTGERKATTDCRIMIHSVSAGSHGTIHDMEIDYKESKYLNEKLMQDMADYSKGKTTKAKIKAKCKRDYYMTPEQAINLGVIDSII